MNTPSPVPTSDPALDQAIFALSELTGLFVVLGVIVGMGVLVLFAVLLLKGSRYPWPVPIIAPLAMLTLVFGVVGAWAAALVPLAGAGLGALAGVLTAQLGKRNDDEEN